RPGTQFGRLHSSPAGGHEAGLRRPGAILWRSASGRGADRHPALGRVRRHAGRADRRQSQSRNPSGRSVPRVRPAARIGTSWWHGLGTRHGPCHGDGCRWPDGRVHASGGWLRASPVIPALGFPLSMRLSNCYLEPANHPNVVAPFKRPRTTISPSLVVKDGKPWMAFGSMGGDQQDQWQLQFLLNRLVFDMPVQEAIEAPKFSSEHFPGFFAPHDFYLNRVRIEPGVGEAALGALRARGHELDIAPAWTEGFLCATERNLETGVLEAG